MPIDKAQLKDLLDPERIEREYQKYLQNPDKYIEENFERLRDYDFPVYAICNIRITTKDGRTVPLRLYRAQLRLLEITLEELQADCPVRLLIVKSRQLGCSTFLLAFIYWLTSMRPSRNSLVITQDMESVFNFSSRVRSIMDEAHPLLTPPTKSERRDLIHWANPTARGGERKTRSGAGMDSRIMFMPCKRPGIGRSYTFQAAMLSEAAFWSDMKPKVSVVDRLGALAHAIPKIPKTFLWIETTPNGNNELSELYQQAVKGENEFRPVFLPWTCFDCVF